MINQQSKTQNKSDPGSVIHMQFQGNVWLFQVTVKNLDLQHFGFGKHAVNSLWPDYLSYFRVLNRLNLLVLL